jgi:outer membrane protein assembly factor BamB
VEREDSPQAADEGVIQQSRPFAVHMSDRRRWGVPRLTLSSDGHYAFARVGSPVTLRPRDELPVEGRDSLVALDLTQQGKLLWAPIGLEGATALEGPPVVDGSSLYIAVRASQAQPQAEVACFDLKTGQKRWQTWVCGAESPALGRSEEITHNLLTLHDGVIYFNTNLGCVAALRASDGQTLWVTRYRRANFEPLASGEPAMNFQRDLNPCIYWRGLLFVAPSDCQSLLCLEAASGQLLWSTPASDIVHLLGIGDGRLIASGQRLWWIDPYTGTVAARFPESRKAEPQGMGRGVLAGSNIYWPTASEIYVFDQSTARQVRQPIQLDQRGASGGNLVVANGHLLVTTADKVIAFADGERGASAP